MRFSERQPIQNEPALFIKDKKILIVADLHIGIESELREHGINTNSQSQIITNHLISIIKKYKPKEIILLGDIKHNIPTSTIQERRDVKQFLRIIESYGMIHIVPGNHDGNITKISPNSIKVHSSDGLIMENIGFVHGHRWPSLDVISCDQVIIGHTHPTIMLTDRRGYKSFEPCWIKGKTKIDELKKKYSISKEIQIIVLPAFNRLCGGTPVNREGIVGPVGKIIDQDNSEVYLLDGSFIGKVKDIV